MLACFLFVNGRLVHTVKQEPKKGNASILSMWIIIFQLCICTSSCLCYDVGAPGWRWRGEGEEEKKRTRKELRFVSTYPSPEIVRGAVFLDLI